jgi:hypothetical protein
VGQRLLRGRGHHLGAYAGHSSGQYAPVCSVRSRGAAARKDEAAQAALTSVPCDLNPDNASVTCLRRKGWELQQRR